MSDKRTAGVPRHEGTGQSNNDGINRDYNDHRESTGKEKVLSSNEPEKEMGHTDTSSNVLLLLNNKIKAQSESGQHTRVYGGGFCLECLSGTEGSYGDNVPMDERGPLGKGKN
ncbi:hypothetical protein F5Y19DRAFT_478478 [Xylariaceae sp. FL1651]|nr:hypothetical protein F5Y19DRAFT_478478 [Xylariaceae sp. FL1651]